MSTEPRVVVRWRAERRDAELYALVLSASGISSAITRDGGGFLLLVGPEDADRARDELAAYDSENQARSIETKRVRSAPPNIEFLLAYWAILLFFFAATRSNALSIDW